MESKEAALHYMMLIVWAGAALVLLFFGYIFSSSGSYSPSRGCSATRRVGVGFACLRHRAFHRGHLLRPQWRGPKIFVPMFRDTLS